MQIVLTGATGMIGRALSSHLVGHGHRVTAWVRDLERAHAELGPDVACVAIADAVGLDAAIAGADAVVHLAGAPIVGKRWTKARKRELIESRVATAQTIIASIQRRATPLPVLLSASAIGIYGDRGDELLEETAAAGTGFAAELCEQWEDAARAVGAAATRVVCARIGIVLGREGGALGPLARLARLGLAGPIAGGAQWLSWIHLDDAVRALAFMLTTPTVRGAVNVVGPAPVPQRAFAKALGRAYHRPAFAPAPGFAMRAMLGEAASVLLGSQRVVPAALDRAGFRFEFPALDGALEDLVGSHAIAIRRLRAAEAPTVPYLVERPARYVLVAHTVIDRPLAEVMPFFAAAENLALLTPSALRFDIQTPTPIAMAVGATIDYRIKLSGVPMRWRTVIEDWQPGTKFVDAQHRGPYRAWWHEHHFRADGDRTIMEDRVYYAPPLGPLGWIANRLFVEKQLRTIFAYRAQAIRLRFGAGEARRAVA
ncbi:MAG: TIGR01777 family oxidoreductase [Deltaproteobacteria bacterium]|nr:TIGR01777 family oxidoreductase [Deltaproteobacteria bacterium]